MSARRLPPALVAAARRAVHRLMGFDRFNAVYAGLPPCRRDAFSRVLLEGLGVRTEWSGLAAESIPATGRLIVVANHPFGLIEGIALDALMKSRRADVTTMAIHLLSAIPEYRDLIFVDPERGARRRKLNVQGLRQSQRWLEADGALAVFPAGQVARLRWSHLAVADGPWSPHVAALARRTHAPVLPVRFHGRNGFAFQLAGLVSPPIHELLHVRQIVNKAGHTLRGTIGRLIAPDELSAMPSDEAATAFLRRQTEALG